jgi:hypothetical protein
MDQITVRRMYLNPVKAGFYHVGGSVAEVFYDLPDFV